MSGERAALLGGAEARTQTETPPHPEREVETENMKMNMKSAAIVLTLVLTVLISSAVVQAQLYFCATSGDWDDTTKWFTAAGCNTGDEANAFPTADDDVIIESGAQVNVNISNPDAFCRTLTVENTGDDGVVNIQEGRELEIRPDDTDLVSTIDGTIYLADVNAELRFGIGSGAPLNPLHTVTGSGEIVGQHDNSRLGFARGAKFDLEVDVRGHLEINDTGQPGQPFTFTNKAAIHADTTGTLKIRLAMGDTTAGLYKVSHSGATLEFTSGQTDLKGDFEVSAGRLDFYGDVNTTGTLTQTGGTIFVQRILTVIFSDDPPP